jgi:hypothetical protein
MSQALPCQKNLVGRTNIGNADNLTVLFLTNIVRVLVDGKAAASGLLIASGTTGVLHTPTS